MSKLADMGPGTSFHRVFADHDPAVDPAKARRVVLSTARMSVNTLEKALEGKVEQLFVVGDAAAARMWAAASYEGQHFARLIGEPNAPRTFSEAYFSDFDGSLMPMPGDMKRG